MGRPSRPSSNADTASSETVVRTDSSPRPVALAIGENSRMSMRLPFLDPLFWHPLLTSGPVAATRIPHLRCRTSGCARRQPATEPHPQGVQGCENAPQTLFPPRPSGQRQASSTHGWNGRALSSCGRPPRRDPARWPRNRTAFQIETCASRRTLLCWLVDPQPPATHNQVGQGHRRRWTQVIGGLERGRPALDRVNLQQPVQPSPQIGVLDRHHGAEAFPMPIVGSPAC